MEAGFVVLIIFIIFVLIASLIILGLAMYNYFTNQGGGNGAKLPCKETIDPETLIDLQGQTPCYESGVITDRYYIGDLDPKLDYVVAPYPTSPEDVCIKYCTTLKNGVCTGPSVGDKTAQELYDDCINQLTPDDCIPPLPLARLEITLYYAFEPGKTNCEAPPS